MVSEKITITADIDIWRIASAVRWDQDQAFELIVAICEEIALVEFDERVLAFITEELENNR